MPSMPTLHIAEYQSFSQSDIKSCLKEYYQQRQKSLDSTQSSRISDEKNIESKAKKIFADLQDFAKQKGNHTFLHFWGSNALKAQNYVGLIQTKSGFCVEILPKTFKGKGFDIESNQDNLCDYHKNDTHKAPKVSFNKQTFATQVGEFIKNLTEAIAKESKRDSSLAMQVQNDDSGAKSSSKDFKHNAQCPICESKQILLNCLATLKDSPFKQSHIASLQSLNFPLLEVFIVMFIAQLERLIHRGLKSDYVQIAQNRTFLKGKLLFNEHLKHNLIHKERFFTQSDEYSLDSAPNRLIKCTLEFLRTFPLSPKTRTRLYSVYFIFEEIPPSSRIESDFAKCQNMRRAKEYELVLLWCAIFLRKKSFSAYSGSERAFALLFPMERLFESFVGYWIKRNVREGGQYEVNTQERSKYLITESKEAKDQFVLKPDMIMRSKGERKGEILILDTKWKIPDSKGDEKRHGIAQADLYQMWAYASKYALESKENKQVSVWLIYPLCEKTKDLQKEWRDKQWCFKASKEITLTLVFFALDSAYKDKNHLKK